MYIYKSLCAPVCTRACMEEWRARRPWLVGNNFRMNLNGTLRAPSLPPPLLLLSPTTSQCPSTVSRYLDLAPYSYSPTLLLSLSSSLSLSLITFSSSFFSSTLPVPSNVHRCVYPTENSLPTRISLPTKLRFSSETVVFNRRRDSNMRLDKAPSPSVASGTCPRSLRRGILIYSSPV